MSSAFERYLQRLNQIDQFNRRLLPLPGLPARPQPTFGEFLAGERRGRAIILIRRAVADAILNDQIDSVLHQIRTQRIGNTMILWGLPRGSFGDLKEFLKRGLIRRPRPQDTPAFGRAGSGEFYEDEYVNGFRRPQELASVPEYEMAFHVAQLELTQRRNHWENRTNIEELGDILYEGLVAFVEAAVLARLANLQRLRGSRPPAVGPARTIPTDPSPLPGWREPFGRYLHGGEWLESGAQERGVFEILDHDMFGVRVGRGGAYYDELFIDAAAARGWAFTEARLGREWIRRRRALPDTWWDGRPGNAVDAFYIYRIPAGTPVIRGVIARQQSVTGAVFPGGGPQVVGPRQAGLIFEQIGAPVPITNP
jgi:hypothetical protein